MLPHLTPFRLERNIHTLANSVGDFALYIASRQNRRTLSTDFQPPVCVCWTEFALIRTGIGNGLVWRVDIGRGKFIHFWIASRHQVVLHFAPVARFKDRFYVSLSVLGTFPFKGFEFQSAFRLMRMIAVWAFRMELILMGVVFFITALTNGFFAWIQILNVCDIEINFNVVI